MLSIKTDKTTINKKNYFFKSIETEDIYYYNVLNKLQDNYDVQQNVKIGNINFDVIATSKNNNKDYLYEIKYWTQTPSFNSFIHSIKDFEARGLEYKKMLSREYKSIFAIIIPLDNFEKVKKEIEKYLDNNIFSNIEIEFNREIVMEFDNDFNL